MAGEPTAGMEASMNIVASTLLCLFTVGVAYSQRVAVLEIEVENSVTCVFDVPDPLSEHRVPDLCLSRRHCCYPSARSPMRARWMTSWLLTGSLQRVCT